MKRKIFIIQDCAHSFGASYENFNTWQSGDFAFFGLNVSKIINSVYGGIVLTNKKHLANKLVNFKDRNTIKPSIKKDLKEEFFYMYLFWFQTIFL